MPVWLLRHYSMYVVGIQLHQNRYVYMWLTTHLGQFPVIGGKAVDHMVMLIWLFLGVNLSYSHELQSSL